MKNISTIILLLIIFSSSIIYSQVKPKTENSRFFTKHSFTFKGEYIYQGHNYLSIGLGYLNPRKIDGGPCNSFILGTEGFSVNTDILLSDNNFHAIPKLSYEYTMLFVATKLNIGTATDFKSNCIIFSPEIGLSAFGFVYLFYGYNFIDKNIYNLSRHKLTLGINLIKTRERKNEKK